LGVGAGARVLISGGLGAVGRAAIQYLQEIGAKPVAGVRPERIEEARQLAGDAIDITAQPAGATFDYAISTSAPVALQLIRHVRDGGQVASIVPVPEGANPGDRVRIHEIYHRADAATLEAVANAAARGALIIPIAKTFRLEQVGAAHAAVAAGSRGKVVLKH
jgi:NADPH:quinone reductase-like Zn-dependent oxidoreductase